MQAADIEKQYSFQKKESKVLVVGRILMAMFLIVGLAGFLGPGLGGPEVVTGKTFKIEYDKYLRYSMNTEIIINSTGLGKDSSLQINSDYVRAMEINRISPQPISTEEKAGKLIFKFATAQVNQTILYIEPIKSGSRKLEISVNNEKQLLTQHIYF